jgi:hypothetical protein
MDVSTTVIVSNLMDLEEEEEEEEENVIVISHLVNCA